MWLVGWRGSIYIDDLNTLAPTYLQCQYWRFWAWDIMARPWWMSSESKMRARSQLPIILGVTVDTLRGTFNVPQDKLDDLVQSMEKLRVLRRPIKKIIPELNKL